VHLIPRFFDVCGGRITVDGHDVRDVSIASLRALIGKVTQETILFNDTVRNNIAYGQPDIPLARVQEAAKMALAHDFILKMPDGYDTIIARRVYGSRWGAAAAGDRAGDPKECADSDSR